MKKQIIKLSKDVSFDINELVEYREKYIRENVEVNTHFPIAQDKVLDVFYTGNATDDNGSHMIWMENYHSAWDCDKEGSIGYYFTHKVLYFNKYKIGLSEIFKNEYITKKIDKAILEHFKDWWDPDCDVEIEVNDGKCFSFTDFVRWRKKNSYNKNLRVLSDRCSFEVLLQEFYWYNDEWEKDCEHYLNEKGITIPYSDIDKKIKTYFYVQEYIVCREYKEIMYGERFPIYSLNSAAQFAKEIGASRYVCDKLDEIIKGLHSNYSWNNADELDNRLFKYLNREFNNIKRMFLMGNKNV